jgi:hypothetical protein
LRQRLDDDEPSAGHDASVLAPARDHARVLVAVANLDAQRKVA